MNTEVKKPMELPAALKDKYKLNGITEAGEFVYKKKKVHLSKITEAEAEALANDEGFPFLSKIGKPSVAIAEAVKDPKSKV